MLNRVLDTMALVYRHKPITRTDRNYLLVDSPQLSVTSSLVYQYTSIPVHHSPFTIIPLHHYTNQPLTTHYSTTHNSPLTTTPLYNYTTILTQHSPFTTHDSPLTTILTNHSPQTDNRQLSTDNREPHHSPLTTDNRQLTTDN